MLLLVKIITKNRSMYRIYLSILILVCLSYTAWAGPVDRKEASRIAAKYINVNLQEEALRSAELHRAGHLPSYHIFNDSDRSGFVIVSGEEGLAPLIGYSSTGQLSTNRLPEQLAELLHRYEEQVKKLRAAASLPAPGHSSSELAHRPRIIIGPLLSSRWNQSTPYNDLAPIKTGEKRAPTGCVATAMSQLMYFHKWPEKGKGSHTYTNKHYGKLSADFASSTYDWSNMKPTYTKNEFSTPTWSETEAKAVARIMYDAAVSVNMEFTPEESGAYTYQAAEALDKNFDYHVRFLVRNAINNEEFVDAIKKELDTGNPILMTGAGALGGHAWILDGYDENGYLHVNWGWGGNSDGYFELDFMNPPVLGIGGGGGRFNQEQQVILARPRKADVTLPENLQPRFSIFEGGMSVNTRRSNLMQGIISFDIPNMGNWLTPNYKGEFGIGLYTNEGELLHSFASPVVLEQISRRTYFTSAQNVTINLKANHSTLSGRYYFAPICREQRLKPGATNPRLVNSWEVAGEWVRMAHSNIVEVVLTNAAIDVLSDGTKPRFTLTSKPEVMAEAWMSRKGSLRASIKNESVVTLEGQVALAFELINSTPVKRDTLRLEPTIFYDYSTVDRPLVYSTMSGNKLVPGQYRVNFCIIKPEIRYRDQSGTEHVDPERIYSVNNPFGDFEVEIFDNKDKPVVEYYVSTSTLHRLEFFHDGKVHSSDMISMKQGEEGKWSIGMSLRNTGSPLTTPVRYSLKDTATDEIVELGTKPSVSLLTNRILSNAQTSVDIDFSSLKLTPGHRYRILCEIQIDGQWRDVWNAEQPRRYLFIAPKTESETENPTDPNGSSTSVETVTSAPILQIYPNPAHHNLHFRVAASAKVELYDVEGRRVLTDDIASGEDTLDISTLHAGSYIIKLTLHTGEVHTERIIIR